MLTVIRLSVAQFSSLAEEWDKLLNGSSADKLFSSWAWLYSWWDTWGERRGFELYLLAAYDQNRLVGLAPLYHSRGLRSQLLNVRQLRFIGAAHGIMETVRTEYNDFIILSEYSNQVVEHFVEYLLGDLKPQEIIITDMLLGSGNSLCFLNVLQERGFKPFLLHTDKGIRLNIEHDFAAYYQSLGKNTRLKFYNRRTYLANKGQVEYRVIDTGEHQEIDDFFQVLNQFHLKRWGQPCFNQESMDFHHSFLRRLCGGQSARLSLLQLNGETLSVLYDVIASEVEYNLQSGFLEDFDKKLSLGTLHLGYAIEEANKNMAVTQFDFLIGRGKYVFYKKIYRGHELDFCTIRFVKPSFLVATHWAKKITRRLFQLLLGRKRTYS